MREIYKNVFVSKEWIEEFKEADREEKERTKKTKAEAKAKAKKAKAEAKAKKALEPNYNMRKLLWFGLSFSLGFMYDI